jgi:hypothetical protein
MRNTNPGPAGSGGHQITGSILSGNVQIAGEVEGGMSMVVGQGDGDLMAQALAALRQLAAALASYEGEEAEQARVATTIIEGELTAANPDRSRVRKAFAKLQETALTFGGVAAAVTNIGKLLAALGLH